ncbi:MAG TPA: tetratricopeptide repeat protein [Candidatus Limnocylindrales bacterium]|nr:tetratricopeptide repeat protein [Candidatus Limnocylindrales bacterium]
MQPHHAEQAPDDRDSAYELFRRGSRMLADRHPGAAAVLLERALALEPGKASILEALGQAYFNQGDHAAAADRFAAIVDADPLAHYAHFGLGLSRARLGDARAARRHLRMAVFLKPESDDYQRALARLGDAA